VSVPVIVSNPCTPCAPQFSCADIIVSSCTNLPVFYPLTATDPCCATAPTVTCIPPSGSIFSPGTTTTVTCVAGDPCGNTNYCNFTVTVLQGTNCSTNCLRVACPTNKTVSCGSNWTFDLPTATTCCTNQIIIAPGVTTNVLVTPVSTVTNGACPNPTLITQTWLITDGCGNSNMCSQTVTITGCCTNTNGCITLFCPSNIVVTTCSNCVPVFYSATATNACCLNHVAVSYTIPSGYCFSPGITAVTVTAVDPDCISTPIVTCTFTVTVLTCTNPPTLTCSPDKSVPFGTAWSFDTPTVSDACCGTNVTIADVGDATNFVASPCGIAYTRTWQATGCCGVKSAKCSQTVTVYATACEIFNTGMAGPAGDIPLPAGAPDPNYILVSGPVPADAVVVELPLPVGWLPDDSQSQWISPSITGASAVGNYRYEVLFPVCCTNTELSGLLAAEETAFVFLNGNYITSVTGPGTLVPINITSGFVPGINVLDIYTTNTIITNTGIRALFTNCATTLSVQCPSNKTVLCGSTWSFDYPNVSSCCGSNVLLTPISTVTNNLCPLTLTQTWLITDACGDSNTCSQTVTISNALPAIGCGNAKTVQCGSGWTFDPPTITACCSNYTLTVTTVTNSSGCPQVLTRTWTVVDCCTNTNSCSQVVTVINTNPPTLTCSPDKSVQFGTVWSFDTPIVSDICCGTNVTIADVGDATNFVASPCGIAYTRTWQATDCCGLKSARCSQTVTVYATPCEVFNTGMAGPAGDIPLPAGAPDPNYILVSGPVPADSVVVELPLPVGWLADDASSQWISPSITGASAVGNYRYEVRFPVCCTNTTLSGLLAVEETAFVFLNGNYITSVSGPSTLVPVNITSGFVPGINVLGIYTTNTIITNTGIRALFTNCATTLTVQCPSNKTVLCRTTWSFDNPYTSGSPSTNLTVTPVGTTTNGQCPQQITQTWLISDGCASTTCSQTVNVVTAPIMDCPTNKTVLCGTPWNFDPPSVGPCCASNTSLVVLSNVTNFASCWTKYTRTWEVTDCCTNSATCSQTVTVLDPGATAADAAAEFSSTANPNGVWAYGYTTSLGSLFILDPLQINIYGMEFWHATFPAPSVDVPFIGYNPTAVPQTVGTGIDPPYSLITHPASNGQYAVLRYVAPAACNYTFDTQFLGADPVGPTTTDVHVLYNSVPIRDGLVNGYGAGSGPFWSGTQFMNANDTLDFAVGYGVNTNYSFDSTYLSATVLNCCTTNTNSALHVTCPTNLSVICGTAWNFTPPTATSCCGTNITVAVLNTVTNLAVCPYTITRTWSITDGCSNSATCSQTVTVNVPGPVVQPVIVNIVYNPVTGLHFTFTTRPCYVYQLEYKQYLWLPGPWTVLQTVVGDGTDYTFVDPPATALHGFYRIHVLCP
jgi:hypothetical protein